MVDSLVETRSVYVIISRHCANWIQVGKIFQLAATSSGQINDPGLRSKNGFSRFLISMSQTRRLNHERSILDDNFCLKYLHVWRTPINYILCLNSEYD